jgi:hypothetical protein
LFNTHADVPTGKGQPDLQLRVAAALSLDKDAIATYIKFAELKRTKEKWPPGITFQLLAIRSKTEGSVGACLLPPGCFGSAVIKY